MASRKTRRAVLALAILAAPLGLAATGSPAGADDRILPRLSTGGCITGIADTIGGEPVCRVIGGASWTGTTNYTSEEGIW